MKLIQSLITRGTITACILAILMPITSAKAFAVPADSIKLYSWSDGTSEAPPPGPSETSPPVSSEAPPPGSSEAPPDVIESTTTRGPSPTLPPPKQDWLSKLVSFIGFNNYGTFTINITTA